MEHALLRLNAVAKSFAERKVLSDVSFTLHRGECLTLIGPSGCGKTTILRLIAELIAADHGHIMRDPALAAPGRLGYVFQDATLMPWANVEANIALPLTLQRVSRHARRERVNAMLALTGLTDFARAAPHELSGGMKMRVALARALITDPLVLLMDEPFAALDEITRHMMNDELLRLRQGRETAIIFVTHSVTEATFLSDRVAILSHRPARILEEYTMPFGAERNALLRSDPRFSAETARLSAALGRAMDDSDTIGPA